MTDPINVEQVSPGVRTFTLNSAYAAKLFAHPEPTMLGRPGRLWQEDVDAKTPIPEPGIEPVKLAKMNRRAAREG